MKYRIKPGTIIWRLAYRPDWTFDIGSNPSPEQFQTTKEVIYTDADVCHTYLYSNVPNSIADHDPLEPEKAFYYAFILPPTAHPWKALEVAADQVEVIRE